MIKLAISNLAWQIKENEVIFDLLHEYQFDGIEIAPTKIFPINPYDHITEAVKFGDKLSKYGFYIPAIQSIWYGREENLFASEEEFIFLVNYTKNAISFARAIGARCIVFGCPKNRNCINNMQKDRWSIFLEEVLSVCVKKNIIFLIEANPRQYGTNFITTTKEAIYDVQNHNHNNYAINLDIGTMLINGEMVKDVFCYNKIKHVHFSEEGLAPIKSRKIHLQLVEELLKHNYQGYKQRPRVFCT